jgi:enoyl-CoA hydratase/carnithine racemase
MSSTGNDAILFDVKGDYAVMTINRPEKRNALSRDLLRTMWDILENAEQKRVRAIVVTGAGDIAFCSGADIKDESAPAPSTALWATLWAKSQEVIARNPAIFIAAVNGVALGGGLTFVNSCQLAVASETATFGAPEITGGRYAALAGPSTGKRVLPKHAAQIVLLGQRVDAATALRMGIVNEVVPAGEELARAEELAQLVAGYDPVTLDIAKNALRVEHDMGWDAAMDHGSRTSSYVSFARETWK